MARRNLSPLPMPAAKWSRVAESLRLSGQQKRIAELILRHQCDKQIADSLGIKHPTVRTYIDRLYRRLEVNDREQLILLFFRKSHEPDDVPRLSS